MYRRRTITPAHRLCLPCPQGAPRNAANAVRRFLIDLCSHLCTQNSCLNFSMADANACSIAPPSPENLQRRVRKTSENPPRAAVYDVIAVAKNCDQNYAGQIYKRLLDAGKVPECAEVDQVLVQPLGSCTCMNQEGGQWGGNRKPIRVATASEMVQILAQLPGNCQFNKVCEEVIAKLLDVSSRDPDAARFIDVADPGEENQGTTRSWQEGSGGRRGSGRRLPMPWRQASSRA